MILGDKLNYSVSLYINNSIVVQKDTYEKEIKSTNVKINKPNLQLTGVRISNMYKLNAGSTVCVALNGSNKGNGVLNIIK